MESLKRVQEVITFFPQGENINNKVIKSATQTLGWHYTVSRLSSTNIFLVSSGMHLATVLLLS